MGLLRLRPTAMVLAFSFYASAIIAVYRVFAWYQQVQAAPTSCAFPTCGIGILIFCKYVIHR
jgi:hypothetical protein